MKEGGIIQFIRRSYIQMRREGLTDREIMKSLGISNSTLYRWKNRGIIPRRFQERE